MFQKQQGPEAGLASILASFRRHRQLLMAAMVDNVRANRCLLCLERGRDRCLCPDCLADLPWLPSACRLCALPLAEAPEAMHGQCADDICHDCRQAPPPWQAARAQFIWDFPVDRLVAALKYHGRLALADLFGTLLAERADPMQLPDLLLPVPVHAGRLRQRGCNQAALLAQAAAHALGLACDVHSLRRVRDTAMQKTLDPAERLANLQAAFAWQGPALAGRRIALIDDVMTTGATFGAICPLLQAAGAGSIEVWAVARTLPP